MAHYNPEMIKLARESREYTQSNFARICGLSQASLSKIEKGLRCPSDDDMKVMSEKLGYPLSFFEKDIPVHSYWKEFYYRRTLNIPQKKLSAFEAKVNIVAENIDCLLDAIDLKVNLPGIDIEDEGISPERLADKIRMYYDIPKGPIKDVMGVVERMGIIVLFFKMPLTGKIDGMSFITRKGIPVILVNKNSPSSRVVFTLVHELGHLIMHYKYIITDSRDVEKEANIFASEFLAPSREIGIDLKYLNANKVMELKLYWRISIKSILYKAKSLGALTNDQYRRWMTMYNAKRWASGEPVEFDISMPKLLSRIFELYFSSLQYTQQELLDILNLNEDDLFELYDLDVIKQKFGNKGTKLKMIF